MRRNKSTVIDLDSPLVGVPDAENPEWTAEAMRNAKTWAEMFPGEDPPKPPRGRPRVETPRPMIAMRLDAKTLAKWRASGKGWQTRAAAVLAAHAPRRRAKGAA